MARTKIIYVSEEAHRKLKILSAQRGRSMGRFVEDMVESMVDDLAGPWAGPWAGPEGMTLQQRALESVWDDPDLDVYNDD